MAAQGALASATVASSSSGLFESRCSASAGCSNAPRLSSSLESVTSRKKKSLLRKEMQNERWALKSSFNSGAGGAFELPAVSGGAPPRINMRVASKGAYICRDCGYIYNDRKPFEKLPDDFFCPVCGAPKRRFKPYEVPVARDANDTAVRKARKAELKKSESISAALPIGIAVGLAGLVGTFLYLNSQY